jgi:hypothetical protein
MPSRLYNPEGSRSNLIERGKRGCEEMAGEVAKPVEARKRLGL